MILVLLCFLQKKSARRRKKDGAKTVVVLVYFGFCRLLVVIRLNEPEIIATNHQSVHKQGSFAFVIKGNKERIFILVVLC